MSKIKRKRVITKGFKCSFCSKSGDNAGLLVVGPQVNICESCVTLAIVTCHDRGIDVVSPALDIIKARAQETAV